MNPKKHAFYQIFFVLSLAIAVVFFISSVGCGDDDDDDDDNGGSIFDNGDDDDDKPRDVPLSDLTTFIEQLRAQRAEVSTGDEILQPFFSPTAQILTVDGDDVQVFEYATEKKAEDEALLVAPDGSSIGLHLVSWIGPPHFYKKDKLIILYVGSDTKVINTLEKVLGKQFAGR
ncbi:MAG: hypothetical protein O7E52_30215 [Candidatus Poribacteria bacterium]|nr:hypothetical protein [Candidatus Poribacteria bacterium]